MFPAELAFSFPLLTTTVKVHCEVTNKYAYKSYLNIVIVAIETLLCVVESEPVVSAFDVSLGSKANRVYKRALRWDKAWDRKAIQAIFRHEATFMHFFPYVSS